MAWARGDFEVVRASAAHMDLAVPLFDVYRRFYGQPRYPEGARSFLQERTARGVGVVPGPRGDGRPRLRAAVPSFSLVSMKRLWILNDMFGASKARRRGVAAALLKEARRLAVETRAKGLELATAAENLPAQRLYERLGWERDDAFHHYLSLRPPNSSREPGSPPTAPRGPRAHA